MIGNARHLIDVGLHQVKGVWYMYWRGALYSIPPGLDKAVYLTDHLLAALRGWSADYNPGLYAGVPNSSQFKAKHQIVFRISQFDLFADERDDYLVDCVFDGERHVHECETSQLSTWIRHVLDEMDLMLLQRKLSEP